MNFVLLKYMKSYYFCKKIFLYIQNSLNIIMFLFKLYQKCASNLIVMLILNFWPKIRFQTQVSEPWKREKAIKNWYVISLTPAQEISFRCFLHDDEPFVYINENYFRYCNKDNSISNVFFYRRVKKILVRVSRLNLWFY